VSLGQFISFEGIEGVGKSTQVREAAKRLTANGQRVLMTREPGGTPLAERIRGLVLHERAEPLPVSAELCLMFAARAVHTDNLIRPALARGEHVLCDRYLDATYAYQGGGRGVPDQDIAALARLACGDLRPDLTIWLDAPVEVALQRMAQRGELADRFEQEKTGFFERVRAKYLLLAKAHPERIVRVDASAGLTVVSVAVEQVLRARGLLR
jgi:dTMP kinase